MLSLVIPCYNESQNIPLIVARLQEAMAERRDVEVFLVNNGSQDDSAIVLESELARAKDARLQVLNIPVNQGYGYGILEGLKIARGDVLAWTHADMQTDPKDALIAYDLFRARQGEKIIVKGKRKNRVFLERLFTFGMQLIASCALGVLFDDVNAQPKLFGRAFYERAIKATAPHDFSLDLFLIYQAKKRGYAVLNVPVFFPKRLHGEAKGGGGGSWKNRLKLIRRTLAYVFKLAAATRRS